MRCRRPVVAAFAVALAAALAACGGGADEDADAPPVELEPANPASGCGGVTRYPSEGATHVARGTQVTYGTQPPTSGNHLQIWGATGTYGKEIPDELQVHNLEHGHVVVQYVPGRIDAALLDALVALARANEKWVILAPRAADRLTDGTVLAFTAWRTLQVCDKPTAAAAMDAASFVKRYGQKAPEKVAGSPVRETPPRDPVVSSPAASPSPTPTAS